MEVIQKQEAGRKKKKKKTAIIFNQNLQNDQNVSSEQAEISLQSALNDKQSSDIERPYYGNLLQSDHEESVFQIKRAENYEEKKKEDSRELGPWDEEINMALYTERKNPQKNSSNNQNYQQRFGYNKYQKSLRLQHFLPRIEDPNTEKFQNNSSLENLLDQKTQKQNDLTARNPELKQRQQQLQQEYQLYEIKNQALPAPIGSTRQIGDLIPIQIQFQTPNSHSMGNFVPIQNSILVEPVRKTYQKSFPSADFMIGVKGDYLEINNLKQFSPTKQNFSWRNMKLKQKGKIMEFQNGGLIKSINASEITEKLLPEILNIQQIEESREYSIINESQTNFQVSSPRLNASPSDFRESQKAPERRINQQKEIQPVEFNLQKNFILNDFRIDSNQTNADQTQTQPPDTNYVNSNNSILSNHSYLAVGENQQSSAFALQSVLVSQEYSINQENSKLQKSKLNKQKENQNSINFLQIQWRKPPPLRTDQLSEVDFSKRSLSPTEIKKAETNIFQNQINKPEEQNPINKQIVEMENRLKKKSFNAFCADQVQLPFKQLNPIFSRFSSSRDLKPTNSAAAVAEDFQMKLKDELMKFQQYFPKTPQLPLSPSRQHSELSPYSIISQKIKSESPKPQNIDLTHSHRELVHTILEQERQKRTSILNKQINYQQVSSSPRMSPKITSLSYIQTQMISSKSKAFNEYDLDKYTQLDQVLSEMQKIVKFNSKQHQL